MRQETKIFLGIGLFTVLVFAGIIWLVSKSNTSGTVNADVLVRPDSQKIESPGAKVVLVEFGDYQCPACKAVNPLVNQILKDYTGKITFVFRNFLLPQHQYAIISAESAEIAGDQGKFWEMHDMIYDHQDEWVGSKSPKDIFLQYAKNLGMNTEEFKRSLDANKYSDKIERDRNDGHSINIDATPTFFVNGQKLVIRSADDLKSAINNAFK